MDNDLTCQAKREADNHVSGRRFERFILPKLEVKIMDVLCKYHVYDDQTKAAVRAGVRYSLRFFFKFIERY